MTGDESCRFCSVCQKEVHNLAALDPTARQTLLSSPAAKLCGRYRAAIRRPSPGREMAYWRHLARYGAGVAAAGAATFVFWESSAHGVGPVDYIVGQSTGAPDMPRRYYREDTTVLLGDICELPARPGLIEPISTEEGLTPTATPLLAQQPPRFHLTVEQVRALLPQLATSVPLDLTDRAAPAGPSAGPAVR